MGIGVLGIGIRTAIIAAAYRVVLAGIYATDNAVVIVQILKEKQFSPIIAGIGVVVDQVMQGNFQGCSSQPVHRIVITVERITCQSGKADRIGVAAGAVLS